MRQTVGDIYSGVIAEALAHRKFLPGRPFISRCSIDRTFLEDADPFHVALSDLFDGLFTLDITIAQRDQWLPE